MIEYFRNEVLTIYPTELENVEKFNQFTDFLDNFELQRGKDNDKDESDTVGEFKVGLGSAAFDCIPWM